ncbi:hypothetical protein CYMTET_28806 [Cymbomonas tetramitiformis]|uniref:Uncharacterized protein n=1 Tax=Cymbomonas tetramitiformis TaxID=36881 RepID=A0AAE0FME2_9CHLO|nr:hypothetical protein CYMTET_28806 [Cymbomonas tetramitiformis]
MHHPPSQTPLYQRQDDAQQSKLTPIVPSQVAKNAETLNWGYQGRDAKLQDQLEVFRKPSGNHWTVLPGQVHRRSLAPALGHEEGGKELAKMDPHYHHQLVIKTPVKRMKKKDTSDHDFLECVNDLLAQLCQGIPRVSELIYHSGAATLTIKWLKNLPPEKVNSKFFWKGCALLNEIAILGETESAAIVQEGGMEVAMLAMRSFPPTHSESLYSCLCLFQSVLNNSEGSAKDEAIAKLRGLGASKAVYTAVSKFDESFKRVPVYTAVSKFDESFKRVQSLLVPVMNEIRTVLDAK